MKNLCLLAVIFLVVTQLAYSVRAGQGCKRLLQHSHEVQVFHHGQHWEEHCRVCHCLDGEVTCQYKQESGFTPCNLHYDPSYDPWCLQWSKDGCCCLQHGCLWNGKIYSPGENFTYWDGPCKATCKCIADGKHCFIGPWPCE